MNSNKMCYVWYHRLQLHYEIQLNAPKHWKSDINISEVMVMWYRRDQPLEYHNDAEEPDSATWICMARAVPGLIRSRERQR